jgi:exodeoxyribonuclease VII small subunit
MKDKKYYGNIQDVENIILMLEKGAIGSDEARKLYDRGISLIKECKSMLFDYEGRIEDLSS